MTKNQVFRWKNKKYLIEEELGRGGFGTVYKAEPVGHPGKPVAIKIIRKKSKSWNKPLVKKEIKIHTQLNNANNAYFVKLLDTFEDDDAVYMILELCECSLKDHIKDMNKKRRLEEREVYDIFKQIVDGVQYLHSMLFIHRDLKPENILLTYNKQQVKIADFGMATQLESEDERKYTVCGTPKVMPPEVAGGKGHGEKADIYGLGVILYALFFGETPPEKKKPNSSQEPPPKVKKPKYPLTISPEAKELLDRLLNKDENKRPTAEVVEESEFFKKHEEKPKSENSSGRRDDSGNGSGNHFSSPIERGSRSSSRDSGCNSKKSSKSSRAKGGSEEKFNAKRPNSKKELLPPRSYLPNRHERSASAEKERIKFFKIPHRPDYSNNAHQLISNRDYKSQECYRSNDSGLNSPWKTPQSCNAKETEYCNDPSCRFRSSFLEGQHVTISNCHSRCGHNCPHSTKPEKLTEHSLEQRTSPLNAARLYPKRYKTERLVLHISSDRQVIMEVLKEKIYVSEVFIISTDGMQIKKYKPQKNTYLDDNLPPPLPNNDKEIKCFMYQNCPKSCYKMYLFAKQFVDILRAKKPKLINNGENAKFYVMENSPDPDMRMEFYEGGLVIKKNQEITIIDKVGRKYAASAVTKNLNQDLNLMLEEFLCERNYCEKILKFHESLEPPNFPIVMGMPKK